jgi:hypothetical protein
MTKLISFCPHSFATKIEFYNSARIFISPKALNDMTIMVDECETEIGWMGFVDRIDYTFIIREVFLAKQEVSAASVEFDKADFADKVGQLSIENMNRIRFWGHSHVNMGTEPSGTDKTELEEFVADGCDYMICGIFNKSGRAQFTLLFDNGLKISDVPWSLYVPAVDSDRVEIKRQMDEMVKKKTYTYSGNSEWWKKQDAEMDVYIKQLGIIKPEKHSEKCICKDCIAYNKARLAFYNRDYNKGVPWYNRGNHVGAEGREYADY